MPRPAPQGPAWPVLPTFNSPDGTGEIAERLTAELPVEALHRPRKEGLARFALGIEIRDLTEGFKCFRRQVLAWRVPLLRPRGER